MKSFVKNILINFTTNTSGGGYYHAIKFVSAFESDPRKGVYFAFNEDHDIELSQARYIKTKSPARYFSARKELRKFVLENNITLVYTSAGPSYVKFHVPEIVGLSNAWLLKSNDILAWKIFSLSTYVRFMITVMYQRSMVNRNALRYVFQSDQSKRAFIEMFRLDVSKCHVIENAAPVVPKDGNLYRANRKVIIPGSYYPHKGIDEVSHWICEQYTELKSLGLSFYFTLPEKVFKNLSCADLDIVNNIGRYLPEDETGIIINYEIVMLPSYIETVSATALCCGLLGKKVVCRNTDFNRTLFGSSVYYFDSLINIKTEEFLKINSLARIQSYRLIDYEERYRLIFKFLDNVDS